MTIINYSNNKINFSFSNLKVINYLLIILSILILTPACIKDSTEEPFDRGYAYYPLTSGNWIVYRVDSIDYNGFTGVVDTFSFQIKEVIGDVFFDNSNRLSHKIERYYRINSLDTWQIVGVYYATATTERVERIEENVRFMKLAFPVLTGLKWNGNAFNTMEPLEYKYVDINSPFSVGTFLFDSCAFVSQQNEVTLISRDIADEIYARNVGMVYRKAVHLELNMNGTIKSGVDYSYSIIDSQMSNAK
jgi:hypothetical protein